jgi:ABC-2 type transport system permease protein
MKKVWEIIRHEYLTQVRRKSFWVGVFSIPILMVLAMGISVIAMFIAADPTPVGYVDHSGVLAEIVYPESENPFGQTTTFVPFEDTTSARQAFLNETVQGYFVIDENYINNGMVEYFTGSLSFDTITGDFRRLLRFNLLQQYPEAIRTRVYDGSQISIRSLQTNEELNLDQWWNLVLPLVFAFVLFILVQVGGGYILQAMVAEKENRMMEILITAVNPLELMLGKTIGNLAVAFTMLAVWGIFGGGILLALPALAFIQISINWGVQIMSLLLFLFTLLMMAGFMMAAGAMSTDAHDSGQLTWFFSLIMTLPFILITKIIFDPNAALSVFFSLFPFTAFFVMPIRMTFASVPLWQLILCILLVAGATAFSVRLATVAMKRGMLTFNKRLKYIDLFKSRRQA